MVTGYNAYFMWGHGADAVLESLINSTKSSIPFDLYSDMHGDRYIYIHAG